MLCMSCMSCTSNTPGSRANHGRRRSVRGARAARRQLRASTVVGVPSAQSAAPARSAVHASHVSELQRAGDVSEAWPPATGSGPSGGSMVASGSNAWQHAPLRAPDRTTSGRRGDARLDRGLTLPAMSDRPLQRRSRAPRDTLPVYRAGPSRPNSSASAIRWRDGRISPRRRFPRGPATVRVGHGSDGSGDGARPAAEPVRSVAGAGSCRRSAGPGSGCRLIARSTRPRSAISPIG